MFDPGHLLPYTVAVIALVLAPGPNQAMVLARSLNGGRRAGITASFGLNTGTMVHTLAAALGLSAVLATSAVAFSVIKLLGAAYLLYLGIRLIAGQDRAAPANEPNARLPIASGVNAYLRAVITGILNPKVAIFFLAFLPQFVERSRGHVFFQFLLLGLIFAIVALIIDSLIAVAAGSLGRYLARNPTVSRWREGVTGAAFIGLGVRLALEKRG